MIHECQAIDGPTSNEYNFWIMALTVLLKDTKHTAFLPSVKKTHFWFISRIVLWMSLSCQVS